MSAPNRPRSRAELLATARREARIARGRRAFVWQARVLPIGVPLGLALGTLTWQRQPRRRRRALGTALTVAGVAAGGVALAYAAAALEWKAHRARRIR